ncbi:hypothetical protein T4B_12407 [Trichinella pseudospiralis]|uniref:Uncharacterized protein n=1 Tax=Trichinella pseudospiralis TaxID=6337 RepID=A0A0V1KCR1_TRIPS|nr:hypothetical protein T4B_12407 [Trichinella pseudospiralis]KRZ45043.1 hypothetical protein T4C_4375 [Trichinella pseudospiralis]
MHIHFNSAAAAAQERITSVPTANSDWPTEQPAVSQLTRRDDIDVASRRTQLTLWANFVVQVLLLPIDRPLKTKKIMREEKEECVMMNKIFTSFTCSLRPKLVKVFQCLIGLGFRSWCRLHSTQALFIVL